VGEGGGGNSLKTLKLKIVVNSKLGGNIWTIKSQRLKNSYYLTFLKFQFKCRIKMEHYLLQWKEEMKE